MSRDLQLKQAETVSDHIFFFPTSLCVKIKKESPERVLLSSHGPECLGQPACVLLVEDIQSWDSVLTVNSEIAVSSTDLSCRETGPLFETDLDQRKQVTAISFFIKLC